MLEYGWDQQPYISQVYLGSMIRMLLCKKSLFIYFYFYVDRPTYVRRVVFLLPNLDYKFIHNFNITTEFLITPSQNHNSVWIGLTLIVLLFI